MTFATTLRLIDVMGRLSAVEPMPNDIWFLAFPRVVESLGVEVSWVQYPQLNGLINEATTLVGAGGTNGTVDLAVAYQLFPNIDEIAEIFWETKKA